MIVNISKDEVIVTELYQYDYGQKLEFTGFDIPDNTELQYFQGEYGCKVTVENNEAEIPDYLLSSSLTILAYLYTSDEQYGKTIKKLTLLVLPRDKPPDYVDPTKPADYSRLLPLGGEVGELLVKTDDGYAWNDGYATDEDLKKVSEQVPIPMTVQDILKICVV